MDLSPLLERLSRGPASPGELAVGLGIDPRALPGLLDALRGEGLDLDGDGMVTLAHAGGFGPHTLAWRCGRPVHFLPACGSTNDEARRLARQSPPRGALGPVVVADRQDAGRGRLGRAWESEPGRNLTFTMVLRPPVPPHEAPRCVLVWAAALAEALDVRVKWPNDLVDGRGLKLGGLLAELELRGGEVAWVLLGVGVNVNQVEFPGLPEATSLARLRGRALDRAEVLGSLVRQVDAVPASDLSAAGLDRWRARSDTLGRRVVVSDPDGGPPTAGLAEALRDDGALIVDGHPILAGDVRLVSGA